MASEDSSPRPLSLSGFQFTPEERAYRLRDWTSKRFIGFTDAQGRDQQVYIDFFKEGKATYDMLNKNWDELAKLPRLRTFRLPCNHRTDLTFNTVDGSSATLAELGAKVGILTHVHRPGHLCVLYEDESGAYRRIWVPAREMTPAWESVMEKNWAALQRYPAVEETTLAS
jgi:hypothetical protein